MEKLEKIIEKRIKMRPWLICGLVLFLIAIVSILVTIPYIVKTNNVLIILPMVIIFLLGVTPWIVLDHMEAKISRVLSKIVKDKLIDFLKQKNIPCEMDLEVMAKHLEGNLYFVEVSTKNIFLDLLSLAVTDTIKSIYKELNYNIHIRPAISKVI